MRSWLWFGAAALAVTLAAPAAQAQPRGSYLQSCTNVQTTGGGDPQLTAVCTDMRGQQRYTSLRYAGCVGDIGNNNGQLLCQGGRPGDQSQSNWNGGNGDQSGWNNGNGDRSGRNGGDPGGSSWSQGQAGAPRGSYLQSCRNVAAGGGLLRATCQDMRGRWQYSTLNYTGCVGDIGNNNGQLACSVGRSVAAVQPQPSQTGQTQPGGNQGGANQPVHPHGH
jgi:hypothetical protein